MMQGFIKPDDLTFTVFRNLHKYAALLLASLLCVSCAVAPKPLKHEELLDRVARDRGALYDKQEPVTAPLSLEEVMARALKYNLDYRVKLMEDALALKQLTLAKWDMLPRIVADAGYFTRNNYYASSSVNVFTREQSLAPSFSQDKDHTTTDLTLTWNILDFGVSYCQARQQADRTLIMTERRRKVIQTIMQQVRHAYWMALGAQEMESRFEPLFKEVEQALKDASRVESERLRSPLEALAYRKTLLEMMRQLEAFRDELTLAKTRLASLINLPPGQPYRLAAESMDIPQLPEGIEQMETRALLMRPELREADYTERISGNEVRKAVIRMFPGIGIMAGWHHDSNSLLVWNNWYDAGARATWNLLNTVAGPTQYRVAITQGEITAAQRLALSIAVLTQLHLAYRDFFNQQRQYDLAKQLQEIDETIHQQTKNAMASGAQNRLMEIRSAAAALMAQFRRFHNYASVQNAYGQIMASIGIDPLPDTVPAGDVTTLATAIRESWKRPWVPISLKGKDS